MSRTVALGFALGLSAVSLAADPLTQCEAAYRARPDGWNACGCFYDAVVRHGLLEGAERHLEAHHTATPDDACLNFNLGRLRLLTNQPSAGPLLLVAAEGYAALGEYEGEVYAWINRSRFLRQRGDVPAASEALEAASRAAEVAGDSMLGAQVPLEQARNMLQSEDDLERAIRLLFEVEALAFPDGPTFLRRDTLQALGEAHFLLGRYRQAETYYRRTIEVTRESGDLYGEATALYNAASARLAAGPGRDQQQATLELLQQVLDTAIAARQQRAEAYTRLRIGKLLGGAPGREAILASIHRALEIDASDILAEALGALAVQTLPQDPIEAQDLVDEALAIGLESPAYGSGAYGWFDRFQVIWATRPREAATTEAFDWLRLIERLRDLQRAEGSRTRLFAVWSEVYYLLAGRYLDPAAGLPDSAVAMAGPPDLELAFTILERLRARVLLESLVTERGAPTAPDFSRSGDPRSDELTATLRVLVEINRRLLDPSLDLGARAEALAELDQLERREAEIRDQQARSLVTESPTEAIDFATLADVGASLAEDEALLAFQLAPWEDLYGDFVGGSWLIVVTQQDSRAYRLPGRDALEPVLKVFQHLFPRRNGSEALPARRLFDDLLQPALDDLPGGIERLTIVPDGALHRLPFAALETAEGESLSSRYRLTIAPSATLWLRWRSIDAEAGARTLILADPRPAGADSDGTVPEGVAERGWPLARGVRLSALPYARKEGRLVARRLGRSSELLLGEAASERALKAAGGRPFGLLHFAAHAVVDGERPQRSAVVLSPGGPEEDGLLQPREIAALDLTGSVVVLSTCQSAAGTVLAGEGPLSLARAFFQAGARTVVGSLWPLRDDEAAKLFAVFYRHLGQGQSVATALANAQTERRATGAPAADWAGVSVLGDGDAVPLPGGVEARPMLAGWIWVLAIGLGIGLLGFAASRRRLRADRQK
ncbi:MAG: CHAT domain-containing tetratricopeptide repeat protein [Acidobacteriota bacterium]